MTRVEEYLHVRYGYRLLCFLNCVTLAMGCTIIGAAMSIKPVEDIHGLAHTTLIGGVAMTVMGLVGLVGLKTLSDRLIYTYCLSMFVMLCTAIYSFARLITKQKKLMRQLRKRVKKDWCVVPAKTEEWPR